MTEVNVATGELVESDHIETTNEMVLAKVTGMSGEGPSNVVSSITNESIDDRKRILSAITTSTPLADELNKKIKIKEYVLQATTMIDDDLKREVPVLRVILISPDGKAYHAISDGIYKALDNFVKIIGPTDTWGDDGLEARVVQKQGRRGWKFLTLELA